jgi:predicted flavoprotein YhiN
MQKMKIAVIGGGAAGFMAAVTAKENNPNSHVTIFEKSNKIMLNLKLRMTTGCFLNQILHKQLLIFL